MPEIKVTGLQKSLLQTLIYADIFDYPLNSEELWKFLIDNNEIEPEVVQEQLGILTDSKRICTDGKLYFLNGRENIVGLRGKRAKWAEEKMVIARKTAEKLKKIPGVKLIGITGALAMNNTKEDDDIDLVIITAENSLWLTRLLIILASPFFNIRRRKPSDSEVKNKICFNLFLEENYLQVEPENLFLAHEICQMKPIYDSGGVYERFIMENLWVQKYLPNAINKIAIKQDNNSPQNKFASLLAYCLAFLNKIAFWLQYQYMQPKKTIEKVSLHQVFFHPLDLQKKINKEFEGRLKSLTT